MKYYHIARCDDVIIYFGQVHLIVNDFENEIFSKLPSNTSNYCGKSMKEFIEKYGFDFYQKIDPNIFTPAKVHAYFVKNDKYSTYGDISNEYIRYSI